MGVAGLRGQDGVDGLPGPSGPKGEQVCREWMALKENRYVGECMTRDCRSREPLLCKVS